MRLLPYLVCLGLTSPLWCAETPKPETPAATPPGEESSDPAVQRRTANSLNAAGLQAMREADADPKRGVDAALSFASAMHLYEKLDDVDSVCEMQANIFWCKKRMNLENLQEYVAKKGGTAQQDLARAQMVMTKEVPVSEAGEYLDRATKYQAANPDNHFQIAIRFSEVIERFPDTDAAKTSSQVFAKEQSAYLSQVAEERKKEKEQLKAELAEARKSRFMQPPPVAEGTTSAMPDKAGKDTALATLKKAYKDDYAKKKDSQKRAFAKKLLADAQSSRDDAALYFVMLDESARLASESEDYETLLTAIERTGAAYAGFDVNAAKRAQLKKMGGKATSTMILKLLDDPNDKAANTAVGKFFCFNIARWDLGLPMLSLGADPDMHAVAEMEISGPKDVTEQKQTADAWYEVGKKATGTDHTAMWSRAQFWYAQSLSKLSGVNKQLVEKKMDEIDKVLPAVITDWENVTPKQWDKLKGTTLTVECRLDRSDGGITIAPGQRIRIVPQPTDEWKFNDFGEDMSCTYKGMRHYYYSSSSGSGSGGSTSGGSTSGGSTSGGSTSGGSGSSSGGGSYFYGGGRGKFAQGALVCKVGDGEEQAPGILTGKGHLWIMPHNNWGSLGTGSIRVKIVPVSDDE